MKNEIEEDPGGVGLTKEPGQAYDLIFEEEEDNDDDVKLNLKLRVFSCYC